MNEPVTERIHALPILMLVFGSLSVGCGLWFVVSEPLRLLPAVLLLLTAAVLFTAAGISLRAASARDVLLMHQGRRKDE